MYLILIIFFSACQNTAKKQELNEIEKLKKENKLLKNELDSILILQNIDTAVFKVDQTIVKEIFLKFLPKFSGGRNLSTCIIKTGDLNGDSLIDAVVDYGLEPTWEDNGGGGNAISEISGLVAFINNGKTLIVADHTEEFCGNFGSRNELKKIKNGIIYLDGYSYADDDPRCCPSIQNTTKLGLINNKVIEIK